MKTEENNSPSNSEPNPQQRDSVLTPQTPSWSWGITLVLVAVGILLIFAGFYFGVINV